MVLDGVVVVRDQLGFDGTGLENTDSDVLLRDFLAERFGEPVHSELRHVVRGEVRPCLPAGDRGDVHDVRDAAQIILGGGQQVRQGGLGHEEQAVLVDRDHPLPLRDILSEDGSEQHQTGVVDEDVEASEPVDDRLHGAFGLDAVGDVGGHGEGGAAGGLDLGDEDLSRSSRRATTATVAPSSASCFAVASPMPLLAPVTIATVPANLFCTLLLMIMPFSTCTARSRLMFRVNAPLPELAWPYLWVPRQGPSTRAEAA